MPPKVKNFILAMRPPTLLVGLAPVLLGNTFGIKNAVDGWLPTWLVVLLAFLMVMLLQSGANLVNDVKDFERGTDNEKRLGPIRAVHSGLLTATAIRAGYRACFIIALSFGLLLTIHAGPLVPVMAVLSLAAAYMYTGGPYPLAYRGLGEVLALFFFGPFAVAGTEFLHSASWDWASFLWGFGPGFFAAALMAINNYRDRESDEMSGKRTLALLLKEEQARLLPFVCLVCGLGFMAGYGVWHFKLVLTTLCTISGVLFLLIAIKPLLTPYAFSLNQALKRTAIFSFIYAIMFTLVVGV